MICKLKNQERGQRKSGPSPEQQLVGSKEVIGVSPRGLSASQTDTQRKTLERSDLQKVEHEWFGSGVWGSEQW